MNIITVQNISKFYGNLQALNDVSFSVPEGSIFGILGPNGSGKTTLLSIITDVLKPASGRCYFYDETIKHHDARKQMGTLLETPNFYHYLSAVNNLRINAEIKERGADDIDNVLKKVGLYERRHGKFSTFSLGMKQRLAIASALLGNPKLVILDEPTNGLDPEGIAEIRKLIKQLADEGKTVIMASHLLDEVEKVCSHVAILRTGKLITTGTVDEILANENIVELSAADLNKLETVLQAWNEGGYSRMQRTGESILLYYGDADIKPEELNRYCFSQHIVLTKLVLKKKSLESKFFELIKTNND